MSAGLAQRLAAWQAPPSAPCRLEALTPENRRQWSALLEQLPDQPVGYDLCHGDYQHCYFASAFPLYRRLDFLVFRDDQPLGIWPLGVFGEEGKLRLSSHVNGALGVAPPLLFPGLSEKQEKAVCRTWLGVIASLCDDLDITSVDFLSPPLSGLLPHWHGVVMGMGATFGGQHRLVADLTLPETDYHRRLRKSYKALINSAARSWQLTIDSQGDPEHFAAFQRLHEEVAGRKTRPEATWQHQFAAIAGQRAFALYLHDGDRKLVGASLFNCSRDEAYYAVGAYRRELFDQPLAHLNVYAAIGHARQRGMSRMILGQRAYPGDWQTPNSKEEQIAFFKEGFATGMQVQALLRTDGNRLAEMMSTKIVDYSPDQALT